MNRISLRSPIRLYSVYENSCLLLSVFGGIGYSWGLQVLLKAVKLSSVSACT